ncbi:MAG: hypothetical protein R6V47_02925, partial [Candidatus Delongbacteria bacterium]
IAKWGSFVYNTGNVTGGIPVWDFDCVYGMYMRRWERSMSRRTTVLLISLRKGIHLPPNDRKRARTRKWFMAKITDISTAYKGYVLVSGGNNVSVDNIRILTDGSENQVETVNAPPKRSDQKIETPVSRAQISDGRFLKILKATYGGFLPENSVDVTSYLQSRVSGGKLNAKADDSFLRVNMRSGFEKTLKIKYETNEGVFETAVIHGMETNLPDKNHRKVK